MPGCDAASFIAAAIDGAQHEIRGQAYAFTNRTIAAALIRAKTRGVDVAMLFDKTSPCDRGELVDMLADAGIPVAIDHAPRIAHNKVLVIDAGQPGAQVIEGSFNFTEGAMRNAENTNLIGSADIASYYRAYWDRRRAESLNYADREAWCRHSG